MRPRTGFVRVAALSSALAAVACFDARAPGAAPPPTATHAGWYVAPNGSASNDGTSAQPWSLASALGGAGGKIQPGDTVWLLGGTYTGTFTSTLAGTNERPIIVRQYPGERAAVDGTIQVNGGHVWFWDFEITSSAPSPRNRPGLSLNAPGVKAIDLVVHDNGGNGISAWEPATDAEVYGNLIYNNGRQRETGGYAHGIYAQNDQGTKLFGDNIIFHQFGFGIHAYGESGSLRHMRFVGNVAFHNGIGASDPTKAQPDIFLGGLTPLLDVTAAENMTWHSGYGGGSVWIGYASCGCRGTRITLENNYFVGGGPVLRLQELSGAEVTGNTLVGPGTVAGTIEETGMPSMFAWRGNSFYGNPTEREFLWDGATYTFEHWKSSTGLGSSDDYPGARPTGVKVFVRPNKYEAGRANVVVYDWDGVGSAPVDLSRVLRPGDRYEIRNVQDWFGTPVASGTYAGGTVLLPMAPVTSATPPGGWVATPPVTGPEFNVFVVLEQ